jgi:hypothetical protein
VTIPQFDDTPTENLGSGDKRDPSEFVPWDRVAEVKTPRGNRPGLVMIVRPLERIKDYRDKDPDNDWKTLVIADIAVLDAIAPGVDQYQMPLPPVAPGSQWRNQLVFPGMLNKAWRDKIGGTLIGVVYYGEPKPMPNGTMGKPPFLWRSLATDEQQVRRGQGFMAARPEFLIPIPRVQPGAVAATEWASTPSRDPWSQPLGQQPQYAQGHPAAHEQWQQVPGAALSQAMAGMSPHYQQPPVQAAPVPQTAPPQGYYQQQPAQPVAPAQQAPLSTLDQLRVAAATPGAQPQPAQMAAAPSAQDPWAQAPAQGLSTLDQMKLAAQSHQGQPQATEPPF